MSEINLKSLADRLKQYRKDNQWTLEQLAEQSGVSRSMLSQIERGKANPTLAVTCRVAQALNISIAELVEEPWTQPSIEVVAHDADDNVMRDDENGFVQMLTPPNSTTEFYRLRLAPAATLNSKPHFRGTREILTAHKGKVTVISGSDNRDMEEGDTAYYQADQNHCIINRSNEEALLYMVICLEEPNAIGYEWDLTDHPDNNQ
ncbi:helix-turn-helix domain-containing protein [Aliamphritea ceti]|uniref:helix-turn-helix domain-containing protein n=1 Tax=Aliamphritea ceti TaxID=1524258 RepID=UPI0021C4B076|nr:XRE family transcriptional regulator [Aliamphritea ceti]